MGSAATMFGGTALGGGGGTPDMGAMSSKVATPGSVLSPNIGLQDLMPMGRRPGTGAADIWNPNYRNV